MRKALASAFCVLFSAVAFPSWGAVTSEELVAALGLSGDSTASSLTLESGTTGITPVESAAVQFIPNSGQAVELSTGLAGQSQLGDTDFNDDEAPDCTSFSLTLNVPDGKSHLIYSTSFVTAESDTGSGDYAVLRYSLDGGPSAWEPLGDAYSAATTAGGGQVKTRSSLDLIGAGELALEFEVCDTENGNVDSALVILELAFSTGELVSAADLAEALVPEQYTVLSSRLSVSSNGKPVSGIEAARAVPAEGGVYLYTGIAEDSGIGSTDLLQDVYPDCVEFELELEVPWEGESEFKTLLLTTQFSTVEALDGTGANDTAILTHNAGSPSPTFSLGSVVNSAEAVSRPVLRAIDVMDRGTVTLTFSLCDAWNGSVDSALFISRLFFSDTIDAAAVTRPRPDKSKPATGTYAYSKQLLNVPGKSPFLPFDYTIYYSSSPVDNRVTLDCFYLFGLFPMACIPYYDFYRSWTHTYNWTLEGKGNEIIVKRGDGVWDYFTRSGSDYLPKHGGNFSTLVRNSASTFTYTTADQIRYTITNHRLASISDAMENQILLEYPSSGVIKITDTRGNIATIQTLGRDVTIDYAGHATASLDYEPDSEGSYNLVSATDALGQTTEYRYRNSTVEHNLLERIIDPEGRQVVRLSYDGDSRVTRQWDANGSMTTTTYKSNFVFRKDREGSESLNVYDLDDRVIVAQDPLGGIVNYEYDENHNTTRVIDPLGSETTLDYEGPNLTSKVNSRGYITTSTYDGRNNKLTNTVSDGSNSYTSNFSYDEIQNLRTVTDPLGQAVNYTYNPAGQVASSTDRNGNRYQYFYDELGNLEATVDPTGAQTLLHYDDLGRMIRSQGPRGEITQRDFDALGRMTRETDALGRTTSYTYDSQGRVLTEQKPGGATMAYDYYPTGEVSRVTDPLGISVSYEYDREGRQTRTIDPLGQSVVYDYDEGGRLVRVDALDQSGRVVNSASASYDVGGNNTAILDPRGNTTRFEYDSMRRVTAEIDPLGNVTRNAYDDPRGLLTSFTNARGQLLGHVYDASGRLSAVNFPSGDKITHNLDPNGNRLKTTGRDSSVIERGFDPLNRMRHRTDGYGNRISYDYDAAGNLTALTYSDGKTVRYDYDLLDRLVSVTDWEGRTTRYSYDALGKLAGAVTPDGSRVSYTYDLAGRVTEIEDLAPDGSVIYRSNMGYNETGLRVSEVVEAPLAPKSRKSKRRLSYNKANQLTSAGRNRYRYDADGNMVKGAVGGTSRSFVYNELNQLIEAGKDRFSYDADGVRVETRIDNQVVRNVYDTSGPFPRLLEQHNEKGQVIARYVYGVGLIGRETGRKGELQVYHFDSRGSTVAISDDSGRVGNAYTYSPYGEVLASRGPLTQPGQAHGAPRNPFTFLGRWGVVDDGNGLYLMGARYYAPELMRFVQKDPEFGGKLSDPQSLNRYSYALGNPIQLIDPTGTYFFLDDALFSLIGAVVNMVSVLISDLVSGEWSSYLDYMAAFIGGVVWGETLLYTGNPILAGTLSAVVEQAWLGFTYMMAAPYQFALTFTTPDWKAFGINAGVSIGIGTAMSVIAGGKFPSGLKKAFTAKSIAKAFGKKVWKVALLKYAYGPSRLFVQKTTVKAAVGFSRGFFIRGDRWGVRDHVPLISAMPVYGGVETEWDPLSP